jgi:LysR family transcriptional regulator, transcriptional activator for bauABCD operon
MSRPAFSRLSPPPRLPGAHPLHGSFDDSDLRRLRLFTTVVAAGGLSAATAELQLDLSTVSRQFKELESKVGISLAHRGRGGFRLTAEGEQFHQASRQLLAALEVFSQHQRRLATAAPRLRLGVVDALITAPTWSAHGGLAGALAACSRALPGLELQIASRRPPEIERGVLAGELDCGVLAAGTPAAGLEHHRLYAEANSLYVAPGHPWYDQADRDPGPAALSRAALVVDPYWGELPHPAFAGMATGGTLADSVEGVALLICGGSHAGFLPDHLAASTPALQALRRVCPERYSYSQDIVLTCRRGKVEPAVRELLRCISPRL